MELLKLMEGWKGYVNLSNRHTDAELAAFNTLLSNADNVPAHLHEYRIREALTTSDFPNLFGDVLDRQVLASYKAVAPVWKAFVKMSTVNRIAPQVGGYRYAITGGDQKLAKVAEKGEYLASDRSEARYELSVDKYGRQFDISWEALINDDLGALKDTPERFARAAIRTEHDLVTSTYAGSTALYTRVAAPNNAVGTTLSINSLEAGVQFMSSVLDAASNPIMNRAKYLVVPPGLEMTARQILTSATKIWLSDTDPAAATPYPTTNVIAQYGLQLIVDPYLAIYGTNAAAMLSQWYLFADPKDIAALEFAHLKGHERPEICMKASDKVTIGGGAIGPMSGDFATDDVLYRVRLVFGGTTLDWRATYLGGDGAIA